MSNLLSDGTIKSVGKKIWLPKKINEHDVLELKRQLQISDFLAHILSSRVKSLDEAYKFLTPKIRDLLPDPFHLLDMDKAVERMVIALRNKEKICIFADYDVDGATSSALLKRIFTELNVSTEIYVPDRIEEGYGPNRGAMQKIKDQGFQLIVTVDCGAMAHDALAFAQSIGLDVIVIDHHIGGDSLPEAVAVVNPNRLDEKSAYGYIAAVGVSYLFAVALCSRLKKINYFAEMNLSPPNLLNYLDLVALGTVCDVMPILHLNRAFVAQGLKVMHRRQNIGINSLLDIAKIDSPPNCYHLGFVLGPRVNAGGRVGKANSGASLLSTACHFEAKKLAIELEEYNTQRKLIEQELLIEAEQDALLQQNNSVILIVGRSWHPGVIGIIASRIKDKFNKPVAVIALNNGIGKASCRSIIGVNFGNKLIAAKNAGLIVAGGGHAMAAGFTVIEEQLQPLQNFLNELFALDMENLVDENILEYDMELTSNSITPDLLEDISKLEPYGNANPEPIFKFSDFYVLKASVVGDKHIKCLLAPSKQAYATKPINAIAFNAIGSELEKVLLSSKPYTLSIIGYLKTNRWENQNYTQLHIKDVIMLNR